MADIIPLKKWPGGIGELESGDKIPYAFLGIDGQLGGQRNKVINGKMDIAQRGNSQAAAPNNLYLVDRWQFSNTTSGVVTVSKQSDAPTNTVFQNSLRVAVTTFDNAIAAGDVAVIQQKIEGYNVRDLVGRTFTLSFWVRSSKTGVHCVSFTNSAADRSYVAEYTVAVANTWEYKSITVVAGLVSTGTWDFANGIGLYLRWALISGSTYRTTANSWQSGNFTATANQVNCLDANDNIFAITGVQLEVGAVVTPFEHRSLGIELSLCQRYYQAYGVFRASQYAAGLSTMQVPFPICPVMRATPTALLGSAFVASNASAIALFVESSSSAFWSWNSVGAGQSYWAIDSTALSAEL